MKWDDSEREARWVKDATEWMDIKELDSMRSGPGVFVFADDGLMVKFVGMNEKEDDLPENCITSAMAEGRAGSSTGVLFFYTDTGSSARIFHDFLVRKYDPPYNQDPAPVFEAKNNNTIG
jgi:hypothetical protein